MKKHNRKLGLVGVSLTKARTNRHDVQALTAVRDELEQIMKCSGYLDGTPFEWVTVAVRYGLVDNTEPTYQAINKKYGDLPLAIEVDTHRLMESDFEQLKSIFRKAVLLALVHAGRKYGRPIDALEKALAEHD